MGLICWVRYGSNNFGQNGGTNDDKGKDCKYLGSGDYSPEKAGVGGSTPSLATILSITCTSRISLFGCNWLQFLPKLQLILLLRLLSFLTTRC
jgi:hypothetical protein